MKQARKKERKRGMDGWKDKKKWKDKKSLKMKAGVGVTCLCEAVVSESGQSGCFCFVSAQVVTCPNASFTDLAEIVSRIEPVKSTVVDGKSRGQLKVIPLL